MKQYFIFVCCGAGKLTSYMAEEGIKDGLKKRGWDIKRQLKIKHGLISDVPKLESEIDILVSSTTYSRTHSFPVVNGIGFVVQDDALMEQAVDEVETALKALIAKDGE